MSAGGSRASRSSRRRLASTIGGGPATHARTPAKRPAIRSPATAWTKPRANENPGCAPDSDAGTSSSDSAIVIASRSGYRARNAARLLLHHERQALGAPIEVDHRVRARPRDARHRDERELTGLEVDRSVEREIEGQNVVRQTPQPSDHAAEGPRRHRPRLARLQRTAHLQRAVVVGHALAHQELTGALEVAAAGSVGPGALGAAAHELRLARAARPGGALVRKLHAAPEPGVADPLAGVALEVARPVFRADDDLQS